MLSTIGLVTGLSSAADISFSGMLDADVAADYDSESGELLWQSNHELDLTVGLKLTDKVTVELYATSTHGTVPYGGGAVGDRWGVFAFDGLTLMWEKSFGTISVGDLVYNSKSFGYYTYKRTSPTIAETFIRGIGIDASGLTAYVGSLDGVDADEKSTLAGAYLAYAIEKGSISAKPFAAFTVGSGDVPVQAGVEYGYSAGDLSIGGEFGLTKDAEMDPSYLLLLEPTIEMGDISVAATMYYSITSDKKASATVIEEEYFVYVEPGTSISDELAVGLPVEYHGGVKDADSESIWVVPTVYLYPAKDLEWWIWGGAVIGTGDAVKDNDIALSFGSEVIMNF